MRVYQPGEGFVTFDVQTKLEALLLVHLTDKKSLKKN
jgi:hypothetical protein